VIEYLVFLCNLNEKSLDGVSVVVCRSKISVVVSVEEIDFLLASSDFHCKVADHLGEDIFLFPESFDSLFGVVDSFLDVVTLGALTVFLAHHGDVMPVLRQASEESEEVKVVVHILRGHDFNEELSTFRVELSLLVWVFTTCE
jgi:hypothetical protein